MSIRDEIMRRLQGEVSVDSLADSLAQVIRGEKTVTTQAIDRATGQWVDVSRTVTVTPKSAAAGLVVYDKLTAGSIGITRDAGLSLKEEGEEDQYRRMNGTLDLRIVQRDGVIDAPEEE